MVFLSIAEDMSQIWCPAGVHTCAAESKTPAPTVSKTPVRPFILLNEHTVLQKWPKTKQFRSEQLSDDGGHCHHFLRRSPAVTLAWLSSLILQRLLTLSMKTATIGSKMSLVMISVWVRVFKWSGCRDAPPPVPVTERQQQQHRV